MKLTESQITAQVRGFLEMCGWRPIRHQRTVVPGMFQAGEPGMPDFEFIWYDRDHKGWALVLWIEFKRPGDRRKCKCLENRGTRRRCTVCDQKSWRERETARGAVVIQVSDFSEFAAQYEKSYGWLRERTKGQMELRA